MTESQDFLTGQLLVAMPGMPDARFAHSVIYMCIHNDQGALGLIVNQPKDKVRFEEILTHVGIEERPTRSLGIFCGGPVQQGNGFILHTTDRCHNDSLKVDERFALTQSIGMLREIGEGGGPSKCLFALGYSGWGPGQLEGEIARNGWLNVPADEALVFDAASEDKWRLALAKLKIDPSLLSSAAGRA